MEFHLKDELDGGREEKALELWVDGKLACQLWIVDLHMRVAGRLLRTGGIGGVRTKKDFRKQGHARRCMEFANDWMIRNGYDMALLFGIMNFYHRFGYVTALPQDALILPTRAAVTSQNGHEVRPMLEEDWDPALKLYERLNSQRTGSISRKLYKANRYPLGTKGMGPFVALDKTGVLRGYVVCGKRDKEMRVEEIQAGDVDVAASLLRAVGEAASAAKRNRIRVIAPADHPVMDMGPRLGGEAVTRWPMNAEGMLRILNIQTSLRGIRKSLEKRLSSSGLLDGMPSIILETDIGTCGFAAEDGKLAFFENPVKGTRLRIPQGVLTKLLMGYESVDTAVMHEDVVISQRAMSYLRAMFPKGSPHCWNPDHF